MRLLPETNYSFLSILDFIMPIEEFPANINTLQYKISFLTSAVFKTSVAFYWVFKYFCFFECLKFQTKSNQIYFYAKPDFIRFFYFQHFYKLLKYTYSSLKVEYKKRGTKIDSSLNIILNNFLSLCCRSSKTHWWHHRIRTWFNVFNWTMNGFVFFYVILQSH